MQLDGIRSYLNEEITIVDELIAKRLGSDIGLIRELSEYIFTSGGKRLRPMLVILGAKAFNYEGDSHYLLAAVVELIHTATLLHDDVVDSSHLRRGHKTANSIWGNEASVLVGDYLYSRAFQMMVEVGSMPVMAVLANAANTIAEGEVMQLLNCNDPDTSEERYMEIIRRKTATLFEASAQLGAIIVHRSLDEIDAMANYGLHMGLAFQLVDDALDYGASNQDIGKNIGDDLSEGKPTLPLIHALKHGNKEEAQLIRESIIEGRIDNLDVIKKAIASTQAIEYTYQVANYHASLAVEALNAVPASAARDLMFDLAQFAVVRKF